MMTKHTSTTPQLVEVSFHRNGVGGTPFFAVLFLDSTEGYAPWHPDLFLATYFPEKGADDEYLFNGKGDLSIVSVTQINEGRGIGHENRWISANWHPWIDRTVQEWRSNVE